MAMVNQVKEDPCRILKLQRYKWINNNNNLESIRKRPSLQTDPFIQSYKDSLLYQTAKVLSFDVKFVAKCRPTELLCNELIFGARQTTVCLHFVPFRAGWHLQPIRVYETGGAAERSGEFEMKSSAFGSKQAVNVRQGHLRTKNSRYIIICHVKLTSILQRNANNS